MPGAPSSPAQFPRDGLPEVAFLGRSNVGKSTLLNALAGTRGLARVSSAPGRTRLVNFFRVAGTEKPGGKGTGDLYLVDLPGYGYAKASREVRETFEAIAVSYLAERAPAAPVRLHRRRPARAPRSGTRPCAPSWTTTASPTWWRPTRSTPWAGAR